MRDDEEAIEAGEEHCEERIGDEHSEDGSGDEQNQKQKAQGNAESRLMAPALISIHPGGVSAVVCIGAGIRTFDFGKNAPFVPSDSTNHRAAIRAARFDSSGRYFVTAGDDKLVKLWDAQSWKCLKTVVVNKKPSAVAFSRDSKWLFAADKFGVVYVLPFLQEGNANTSEEPVQLLAHCCSIITSLECSPCGKYVVTADRDFKVRVSVLPKQPLAGAHEIQSFCLGHTSFVSCLAFLTDVASSESVLVSAGGDATIRLWDCSSGELLDTVQISTIVDESSDDPPAVIALTVSCTVVAAGIESFPGVVLFECATASRKLSFLQKVVLQDGLCPTGLQFDVKGRLWLVAGAGETRELRDRALTPEQLEQQTAEAQSSANSSLAWVRVLDKTDGSTFQVGETPGGLALLKALQGHEAEPYTPSATQAAEFALKKLLSKRQYSDEGRERRKRNRNDKKSQAAVNKDAPQETR